MFSKGRNHTPLVRTHMLRILETSIREECNQVIKPSGVPEAFHYQEDFVAPELCLDVTQHSFHITPESDLLQGRVGETLVNSEFGDRLDGAGPLVHVALENDQERVVIELLGGYIGDGWGVGSSLACLLDDGRNGEMNFRDVDVMLQVVQSVSARRTSPR